MRTVCILLLEATAWACPPAVLPTHPVRPQYQRTPRRWSTPEVAPTPMMPADRAVDTPLFPLYHSGMRPSAARGNALGLIAAIVLIPLGLSALDGSARADEPGTKPDQDPSRGDRLSLADLAGYRAALSGKPT